MEIVGHAGEGVDHVSWLPNCETDKESVAMPANGFYGRLKDHQIAWAHEAGIDDEQRETAGNRPWVLKPEFKSRNLYDQRWWRHIVGKEHRWARALTSSQCFAVNLFGPLAESPRTARDVFTRLVPERPLSSDAVVAVALEHTPCDAPRWLGEKGQPTQVDVFFTVSRNRRPVAHLLVEVKLGERKFGSCRGAKTGGPNQAPERCRKLGSILDAPEQWCWLAETQGRRYWELMMQPGSSFRFDGLSSDDTCPFRDGIYQLMRNQVLAEALAGNTEAEWADVGVCIHPLNRGVLALAEPIAGEGDILPAFRSISSARIHELDPRTVLGAAVESDPSLEDWADWMRQRYLLA